MKVHQLFIFVVVKPSSNCGELYPGMLWYMCKY
jgi:hypothetical protein